MTAMSSSAAAAAVAVPAPAHVPAPRSPFTPDQVRVLELTFVCLTSASFVLSFVTVVTYLRFKRQFPYTLAMGFAAFICVLSGFLLMGPVLGVERVLADPQLCDLQATGVQFTGTATIWLYLFLSVNLYVHIVHKNFDNHTRLRIFYSGFTFPVSALLTIIPLAMGKFKPVGLWCWIATEANGVFEFSCFYWWMAFSAVVAAGLWSRVIWEVAKLRRAAATLTDPLSASPATAAAAHRRTQLARYLVRHIVMVVVFFFTFVTMFAHRVTIWVLRREVFVLALLHVIALSGAGIFVFATFGATHSNARLWLGSWPLNAIVRCCRRGGGGGGGGGGGRRTGYEEIN